VSPRLLEAFGPAAGVVIHAQDFKRIVANTVGNDERRFRNDKLVEVDDEMQAGAPRPRSSRGYGRIVVMKKYQDRCPGCDKLFIEMFSFPARSRHGHGDLCSECGHREAFEGNFIAVRITETLNKRLVGSASNGEEV
jgi:hypothetical protein